MWLFGHISGLFGREDLIGSSREERDNGNRPTLFMTMRMVHVRHMWVGVSHRVMFVKMRMRLARRIDGDVR